MGKRSPGEQFNEHMRIRCCYKFQSELTTHGKTICGVGIHARRRTTAPRYLNGSRGEALHEGIRPLPAALFYLVYMGGVVWFAGWPALRDGTPATAFVNGAILGFVAYGTYELTSWTVMRDWHPSMVALDMAWGATLTAMATWGGVVTVRAIG